MSDNMDVDYSEVNEFERVMKEGTHTHLVCSYGPEPDKGHAHNCDPYPLACDDYECCLEYSKRKWKTVNRYG